MYSENLCFIYSSANCSAKIGVIFIIIIIIIYECEAKSEEIIAKYKDSHDPNLIKILKQMARELLLLESSDWQFLITTWSARDYAENRVALHYENLTRLYNMANTYGSGQNVEEGEWHFLGSIEANDDIFEALDLESFAKK